MAASCRVYIFLSAFVLAGAMFKKGSKQLTVPEKTHATASALKHPEPNFVELGSGSAGSAGKVMSDVVTPATPELLAAEPLKWMHTPKCGTSFLNALIHLPGVCPGVDHSFNIDTERYGPHFEIGFQFMDCPTRCDPKKFVCQPQGDTTHMGIGDKYETEFKGHLVANFREPIQRILSAFYDTEFTHGVTDGDSPASYAKKVEHFMTCQIMNGGVMDPLPPFCLELTETDANLAVARLREGFAFVGIMEEWDLSMCLFHRMFGGDCLAADFLDNRPTYGEESSLHLYDTSVLGGFEDPVDRILYNGAKDIFAERLLAYNVSQESCQPCFEQARGGAAV